MGDMTQIIECLPIKHESLSSNPSTMGKKREKKNMEEYII
jgi:hypothetical protein